jgi:hypothetical protein
VVLRPVVAFRAGGFAVELDAGALPASVLAALVDLAVVLAVEESCTMMESPASGGASGCLKNTGRSIETGTG